MSGEFIASWLRMLSSAAAPMSAFGLSKMDFQQPDSGNTSAARNGGRGNSVAQAKREAIKAKNRAKHRMACR